MRDARARTAQPVKKALADLLTLVDAEEAALLEAEGDEDGSPERWSAKVHVAHNAEVKATALARLEEAASGQPTRTPGLDLVRHDAAGNLDQANVSREAYAAREAMPVGVVRERRASMVAALLAHLERLGDDRLTAPAPVEARSLAGEVLQRAVWHAYLHLTEYYRERDDGHAARRLTERLVRRIERHGDAVADPTSLYNLACLYCTLGRIDDAEPVLARAFALDADLRGLAEADPDLKPLVEAGRLPARATEAGG